MKNANVQVGKVYVVKVTGKMAPVRLEAVSPHGGWVGRNLRTNKEVRIKTAAKLRGIWPTKTQPVAEADEQTPTVAQEEPAAEQSTTDATPKPKTRLAVPRAERPSLINLAAAALKETGQPMDCQQMVAYAAAHGWSTGGRTPHATLYSAIFSEIKNKGSDSRFVKIGRGLFGLKER